jgi:SAM-dependent methyltransferase
MFEEKPYHKFIFDFKNRKIVGRWEEMYAREDQERLDSGYYSTIIHLPKLIHLTVLGMYNFSSILDYGCGKGAFTHLLRKENNYVLGVDVSPTAIEKAKAYYGNRVEFAVLIGNDFLSVVKDRTFELTIALEVLSFVEDWRDVIRSIAGFSEYLYVSTYLPPNPIGYIKSKEDLVVEMAKHFTVLTKIVLTDRKGEDSIMLLGKRS